MGDVLNGKNWSVDKWSGVKLLVTWCLSLLEDMKMKWSSLLVWLFCLSHFFHIILVYCV